ncbi:hypothetical protein G7046_g5564 [Stylonectria norvegica]|nr:hypothetical protein G7046_g5564 [Stylonectria norvegica]
MTSLPKVQLFATGGTIAGAAKSATATAGYESGVLTSKQILDAVPKLKEIAQIVEPKQVCNVGSPDIESKTLVRLSQDIQAALDKPDIAGVVVTHGTDTIEETAFFLDLTVSSSKPVVMVGSMRPPSAYSADGPMNLYEAVRLVISSRAKARGTMFVLNDRIYSARYTTKTNANRLDAFGAGDAGALGTFENSKPVFFYPPVQATGHRYFNIRKFKKDQNLPKVNILYGHLELDDALFERSIKEDAKGIVLAGMGAGCWTTKAGDDIQKFLGKKPRFPVVASYRTAFGFVDGSVGIYGLPSQVIGSGFLNPAKARIQLQLCLAEGLKNEETKMVFKP